MAGGGGGSSEGGLPARRSLLLGRLGGPLLRGRLRRRAVAGLLRRLEDRELDAPVLLPARDALVVGDRLVGPIALRAEPDLVDALRHEVRHDGLRPLLRERAVVRGVA